MPSFIHTFNLSIIQNDSFIHSFIHFIHSFIHSFMKFKYHAQTPYQLRSLDALRCTLSFKATHDNYDQFKVVASCVSNRLPWNLPLFTVPSVFHLQVRSLQFTITTIRYIYDQHWSA